MGVQMLWIAEPGVPAEKWQIAFLRYAGERWEFHQESTIAILTALAARELSTPLVPPFEDDEPVEFISYDS
ncbi:hypothetical protein [Glycomyces rhizosphaerae]|uniref:Uncharacterized protein n=1 Tax=Glycomyces rhizosphaerae TaxID=2054422 RepID=A0ABV7PVS1_9ACTN